MPRIRWIVPCFVVALGTVTRPSTAQVAEIQVLPADLNLEVGEQGIVIATLFDARGNPITTAVQLTWISNNLAVASVSFDQNARNLATVTAVSPGIAQIEARSGNIRSTVVVAVSAAIQQPQVQPAVTPDSVLPDSTSNASLALVSRIEPHNFGFAQDCRVGGFVGTNLLLTTYLAIRGADSIVVVLPSGQRVRSPVPSRRRPSFVPPCAIGLATARMKLTNIQPWAQHDSTYEACNKDVCRNSRRVVPRATRAISLRVRHQQLVQAKHGRREHL